MWATLLSVMLGWGGSPPEVAEPVVEHLHGIEVVDTYRWMEQPGHAPALVEWLRQQTACVEQVVAASSGHEALAGRIGIRVLHTDSGTLLDVELPGIWGEFSASWLPDGSGFFCTQMHATALADATADPLQGMTARLSSLETGDSQLGHPAFDGPLLACAVSPAAQHPPTRRGPAAGWCSRLAFRVGTS